MESKRNEVGEGSLSQHAACRTHRERGEPLGRRGSDSHHENRNETNEMPQQTPLAKGEAVKRKQAPRTALKRGSGSQRLHLSL